MMRLARVSALILALSLVPAAAQAAWLRMASAHFQFVGDASEAQMRDIAVRLERFRAVVGRAVSGAELRATVPTTVVVFRNDRTFAPFKPVFEGRPVAVAGYFVGTGDVRYIAVNAEQDAAAYGVVFHEYAHALLADVVANAPAWIDEGLAGFYETFEWNAREGAAIVGAPSRTHLQRLRASPLIPVEQLLSVGRESPLYNSDERRDLFYAQAWALVHYLTLGESTRGVGFDRILSAIRDGQSSAEAVREVLGPDLRAVDASLQRYIDGASVRAIRVDAGGTPDQAVSAGAEPIPEHEAAGYLGDMVARLGRTADARAYLRRAVATRPDAARAIGALGQLEMDAGEHDEAFRLLERAAALSPDAAVVQGAYGRALVVRAERGGAEAEALYDRARAALNRALELEPANVPAAVTLAAIELSRGGPRARAIALLQGVVRAMPGRENYRLMLARALAAGGEYEEARRILDLLAARGGTADMRAAARELLEQVTAVAGAPPAPR